MPIHNHLITQNAAGLTTLGPEALATGGPVLPVEILIPSALSQLLAQNNSPIPAPLTGFALIDTGATHSCVDATKFAALGVNPTGTIQIGTSSGSFSKSTYPAKFRFPTANFELEFSTVIGADLSQQVIHGVELVALLGRDFLTHCLLVYNGPVGLFTLSF